MNNTGASNYSCAPDSLTISFYSCLLDLNYDLSVEDDEMCESEDPFADFLSFIKLIHLLSNSVNNRKLLNKKRNARRTYYCQKYIVGNRGNGFFSIETFLYPFCEGYKGDRVDIPLVSHFNSTFECIACKKNISVLSKEFSSIGKI